jgi:serine/threonine-protein phosphatase 6 regulatory ankyrin repeat subunit B
LTHEWEAAVRRGSIEDLQRLLAREAEIDARDRHGQTALMLAASRGQVVLVEWLVACGAALDHTAKYGLTALMLAVVGGHTPIVRALASAGARLDLRGTGAPGFAGKTALDLAIGRDHPEMIAILRSAAEPRP